MDISSNIGPNGLLANSVTNLCSADTAVWLYISIVSMELEMRWIFLQILPQMAHFYTVRPTFCLQTLLFGFTYQLLPENMRCDENFFVYQPKWFTCILHDQPFVSRHCCLAFHINFALGTGDAMDISSNTDPYDSFVYSMTKVLSPDPAVWLCISIFA